MVFFAFFLYVLVLYLKRSTNHFFHHSHHFILSRHCSIAHLKLHNFTLIRNEPEDIFFFRTTHTCLHVGQSFIFWTLFFAQYSSGFLVWSHNFEVITGTTLIHHDGHSHHPVVLKVMVFLLTGNARLVLSTLVSEIIYSYIYKIFPLMT